MNTTADLLRKARALIDASEKWCQGWGDGGRRCVLHALADVSPDGVYDRKASSLLSKCAGWNSPLSLGYWNDRPGRTHAEVLALMDRAIAAAEAAHA